MGKDSFILYLEQKEILDMLTDEEAGKLIKAIFEYENTGTIPKLDKSLQLAFIPIKSSLDRNKEKYEKVVERNKKNIEKRWQKEDTKNTSGKTGKKENTKNTDNDNERDSDNEHEPDSDNDNNNDVVGDSCVDGLQDVIDFYQNNIGLITPYALEIFTDYAKEMPCDVIVYAMKRAVEANVRTIQYIKGTLNNWQKAGVKTLIQAKAESEKFKNNKQEPKAEETEEEKIQRKIKALEEGLKNANKWVYTSNKSTRKVL